jgi:hypothetical protein
VTGRKRAGGSGLAHGQVKGEKGGPVGVAR